MNANQFDVMWRQDALGVRFTPNENGLPVVCQVPYNACPAVLESPLAVGDVLVAFNLQPTNQPDNMQPVTTFDHFVTLLRCAKLPITLRFISRVKDIPPKIDESDIRHSYVFTWKAKTSLGVSLAMDPCSLHAVITTVDAKKISPTFQDLNPVLGDVLLAISSDEADGKILRLDEMLFESIIRTLREFPRPCRLTFARLEDEIPSELSELKENNLPYPNKSTDCPKVSSNDVRDNTKAPFLLRPMQLHPKSHSGARKHIPISMRQSFRIDKPEDGGPHANATSSKDSTNPFKTKIDDKEYYTVVYSGGAIGLQLRDCTEDDKNLTKSNDMTNRTNDYTAAIRNVTDSKSAPGLEIATSDDVLVAIGQKDLKHMPFHDVRKELGAIQSPTKLMFKKRFNGSKLTKHPELDAAWRSSGPNVNSIALSPSSSAHSFRSQWSRVSSS